MDRSLKVLLHDVGSEIFRKYGTDSYDIRCALHDIAENVSKLENRKKSEAIEFLKSKNIDSELIDSFSDILIEFSQKY